MSLDAEWAIQWVRRSAVVVQEHRDALTALDTAIGDGDHGANLERGYNAAVARLDEVAAAGQAPTTAGEVLQLVATSLITTVGGAAGPLLGTAMLRASHTVDGAQVDGAQVAQMLQEAADAVRLRGRAEAGDKTMLDAWQPVRPPIAARARSRSSRLRPRRRTRARRRPCPSRRARDVPPSWGSARVGTWTPEPARRRCSSRLPRTPRWPPWTRRADPR